MLELICLPPFELDQPRRLASFRRLDGLLRLPASRPILPDKRGIPSRFFFRDGRHAPVFSAEGSNGTSGPESFHKERRGNASPCPARSSPPSPAAPSCGRSIS